MKVIPVYTKQGLGGDELMKFTEIFRKMRDMSSEDLHLLLNPKRFDIFKHRDDIDNCFSFGGDGTFLHAAREMSHIDNGALIWGFNMGTLGFLTPFDAWYAIEALGDIIDNWISGIEERELQRIKIEDTIPTNDSALNDVVVRHHQNHKMAKFRVTIEGKRATDYCCDALIISTATGSTAYSLAAGGPILEPSLEALILTPVAPHHLTHRPLVIGKGQEIKIESEHRMSVIIDGQKSERFSGNKTLSVKDSDVSTFAMRPIDFNIYDVLSDKLKWGERGSK